MLVHRVGDFLHNKHPRRLHTERPAIPDKASPRESPLEVLREVCSNRGGRLKMKKFFARVKVLRALFLNRQAEKDLLPVSKNYLMVLRYQDGFSSWLMFQQQNHVLLYV